MKKENCPFCGHRWVIGTPESPIKCPKCNRKFYSQETLAEMQLKKRFKKR